jgi:hypothetical protein
VLVTEQSARIEQLEIVCEDLKQGLMQSIVVAEVWIGEVFRKREDQDACAAAMRALDVPRDVLRRAIRGV